MQFRSGIGSVGWRVTESPRVLQSHIFFYKFRRHLRSKLRMSLPKELVVAGYSLISDVTDLERGRTRANSKRKAVYHMKRRG